MILQYDIWFTKSVPCCCTKASYITPLYSYLFDKLNNLKSRQSYDKCPCLENLVQSCIKRWQLSNLVNLTLCITSLKWMVVEDWLIDWLIDGFFTPCRQHTGSGRSLCKEVFTTTSRASLINVTSSRQKLINKPPIAGVYSLCYGTVQQTHHWLTQMKPCFFVTDQCIIKCWLLFAEGEQPGVFRWRRLVLRKAVRSIWKACIC